MAAPEEIAINSAYLRAIRLDRARVPSFSDYPFSIPAVQNLDRLEFAPGLTIIVGENGVGKSTLIEAIAIKLGFNPEGGTRNNRFSTRDTHSSLRDCLTLERGIRRPSNGFFLRAESFYAFATETDRLGSGHLDSFGGKSLHQQSHGESFLALLKFKLRGKGLFIFDEPEAALSPQRQLAVLVRMHELLSDESQIIMATHSPVLMGYPGAKIYLLGNESIRTINYEETEHYQVTRDFLNNRQSMLQHLFQGSGTE